MRIPGRRAVFIAVPAVWLLLLAVRPGAAIEQTRLHIGDVTGAGWSASDVELILDWVSGTAFHATLHAGQADFPAPLGRLDSVTLECTELSYDGAEIDCAHGRLQAGSARLGPQQAVLTLHYRLADGQLQLTLDELRYLGGRWSVHAARSGAAWQVRAAAHRLGVPAVLAVAQTLGVDLPPLDGDGRLEATVSLRGHGATVQQVQLDAQLDMPSFTNPDGTLAGENLDLQLGLRAHPRGQGWRVAVDTQLRKGALYIEPVYIAAGQQPLSLRAQLDWQPQQRAVTVEQLEYRHPGVLDVTAHGRLTPAHEHVLASLDATVHDCRLPACYSAYLQPWLHDSAGGQLETAGSLAAELQVREGQPRVVSVDLHRIDVRDRQGRFGFGGLSGRLEWSVLGPARHSRLAWDNGQIYRLALGTTGLDIESTADSVRLLEPAVIPVLDGSLRLDSLLLERPAGESVHWSVNGILTPVSMSRLTQALGWPSFGGKLSGMIPSVRYADGELSVGGVLLVRVFDGEVTLRNVRLDDPFGPVPRLWLDARVSNIDLASLTHAFSFGRIDGRLDGRVDGLEMESWRPVAFDAGFATPRGDRSRHRISQKAVEAISSIGGGGVSGALSRSFLRFLDEFPYDRLGLYCRLVNGTCAMHGVEPAKQGYYIVKGRFLPPRLDIIGYADRVNWDQLVAQVIAVTRGQHAVVK